MSNHQLHHAGHLAKHTAEQLAKMRPLKQRKSPVLAFVLGFCLGGIGLGLYFQSWKDFFVCVGIFLGFFVILLPTVAGEAFLPLLGPTFCAIYGAWRANMSNEKLSGSR
jgi:hypothetical protein